MSINRKKRLRKIAGALLGATAALGQSSGQTEAATDRTSNWTKGSVIATTLLGIASTGILAKQTFGKKEETFGDKLNKLNYDKEMETRKKEQEAEEKKQKREGLIKEYGINNAVLNAAKLNLDDIRGDAVLTTDNILESCSDKNTCELVKLAAGAHNEATREAVMKKVREGILKELTLDKISLVNQILSKNTEMDKCSKRDITAIGARTGQHWAKTQILAQKPTAQLSSAAGANNQPTVTMRGSGLPASDRQKEAGNALLPESLKILFKNAMPATYCARHLVANAGKTANNTPGYFEIGSGSLTYTIDDIIKNYDRRDNGVGADGVRSSGGGLCLNSINMGMSGLLEQSIVIGRNLNYKSAPGNGADAAEKIVEFINIGEITEDQNTALGTGAGKLNANASIFKTIVKIAET